jgi:hypothetical protein
MRGAPDGHLSMRLILVKRAEKCRVAGSHYAGGLTVAGACRACGIKT